MEEDLRRLAVLELGGPMSFDPECRVPAMVSHSVSSTGLAIISFGDCRAVMTVSDEDAEFVLKPLRDGMFEVRRRGSRFIRSVRVKPIIRIDSEHSVFLLGADDRSSRAAVVTDGEAGADALKPLDEYSDIYEIGYLEVFGDRPSSIRDILRNARNRYPGMFIDARTDLEAAEDAAMLRDSGADRIEVDLVTSDNAYDPQDRMRLLHDAAELIGPGILVARIAVGLKETTADLDILMESLCRMGVVPELTVDERVDRIDPEKLIALRDIRAMRMRRHGLDPLTLV